MKRRVLRAHSNKRHLRILSAEHGLRLDAYNVLCDASFLRAVALGGGVGHSPADALKRLMYDTFSAATSHVVQSGGANESLSGSATPKKNVKDLTLSLFFLPETAAALRRMIQKQNLEQEATVKRNKRNRTERSSASSARREKSQSVGSVIEALLTGLECVGHECSAVNRNESKAVAHFVKQAAEGRVQRQNSMYDGKNAHFFFVATQSHDVRRLLPSHAALIRFTTSPTALWIERNGDASRYDGVDGHSGNWRRSDGPAPVVKKMPSAADIAFMRHLSVDFVPASGASKRYRVEDSNGGTTTPPATGRRDSGVTSGAVGSALAGGPKKKTCRKGVRAPNPLSVKKKRIREVFRLGEVRK